MTTKQTRIAALDEAVRRAGGIVKFSKAMGVTHQAVYHWRKRGWVPLERAIVIDTIFKVDRDSLINPQLAQALSNDAAEIL